MLACALFLVVAPRTGTVRIHLTDARNRPIPGHEVWLTETNSTKPVRSFGVQWFIPSGPHHGTTGKNGDAAIPGVPLRKPMMVVVKFGPRFDAFVAKNGNASGGTLDVMKFEGAVYAGKTAHVILAEDREISGAATDATGMPLPNVKVYLSDTGFGHMGGYPGTTLDQQTTDARGSYQFNHLPNCAFLLTVDATPHNAIESRPGKGKWQLLAIVGQQWTSAFVLLTRPRTVCDFRISPTAKLTVVFKGTESELKGWTAWIERGSVKRTGQVLDYDAKSNIVTRDTLPGQITVWIERDRGETWLVANKLTLKPGESRTVEISIADVAKRRR